MSREDVVFARSSRNPLWRFLRTPIRELFRGRVTGPRVMPSDKWWARTLRTPLFDLLRGRVVASGLRKVIDGAGLPQSLSDVVFIIARGTRLWDDERIDIAHELIAHFADGLAHGRSSGELIAEFGDLKQTVKLMRRAKIRTRPLLWRARHRVLQGFGLALLVVAVPYIFLLARYHFASPAPVEPEPVAYLPAKTVNPEERAWPLYRRALAELETLMDRLVEAPEGFYPLHSARPGDDAWVELRTYLEEHKEAFDLLRQGTKRSRLGFHLGEKEDEPALSRFREGMRTHGGVDADADWIPVAFLVQQLLPAAFVLQADVWRAADDGDAGIVLDTVESMLRLGEQLHELKRALFAQMVSQIFFLQAPDAFGRILAWKPELFSDEQLERMAARLQSIARGEAFRLDLQVLRRGRLDRLRRLYSGDEQGDGRLTREGLEILKREANGPGPWKSAGYAANPLFVGRRNGPREVDDHGDPWFVTFLRRDVVEFLDDALYQLEAPTFSARVAGRRETTRVFNTLFDRLETWASRPLWQRGESPNDEWLKTVSSSREQQVRFLPLLALWTPEPTEEFVIQKIDATLTAIALERYRRGTGSWPTVLADLTPERLGRVPLDRFDGRPLRYRLVDGRPLLYSVGVDRDDDDGRPTPDDPRDAMRWIASTDRLASHPDGDWILWPPLPEMR